MIPLRWTWGDLGLAIRTAVWAFTRAGELNYLRRELASPQVTDTLPDQTWRRWLVRRFLSDLPAR